MTTFSPKARGSQTHLGTAAGDTTALQKGINELGRRLLNLMARLGCTTELYDSHDLSVSLLKDFVYDVDEKVQELQQR